MRKRTTVILGLVISICMAAGNIYGQTSRPQQHLQKDNPNELFVNYTQGDSCKGSYEYIVDNELVKSRIKRKTFWEYDELILICRINCLELSGGVGHAFSINAAFGRLIEAEPGASPSFVKQLYDPYWYGTIGRYGTQVDFQSFVGDSFRSAIQQALTDYLRANFDL